MQDDKYIKKLNDFISYDYRYEKFIIEEHTIKIPSTTFSFKRLKWKKDINKVTLAEIVKDLADFWDFDTDKKENKSNLKGRILDFIMRNIWIKNEFDFIEITDKWLKKKW